MSRKLDKTLKMRYEDCMSSDECGAKKNDRKSSR